MIYLKKDGTFGDTHEFVNDGDFDPYQIVCDYFDEDHPDRVWDIYKENSQVHFYDDTYEFYTEAKASDFYDDLLDYAEKVMGRELEKEEIEELNNEFDEYYNQQLPSIEDRFVEWSADMEDDMGWPY